MKVLLRRNVGKLGQIGEIVEVRAGYARNFLIPQGLATAPSRDNIKAVEAEKQAYLAELARQRAELESQARLLEGKELTIAARANEEGHLYGSIGPAQIASAISKLGFAIEADYVVLEEPIRKLDKYEVKVQYGENVFAKVVLWVVRPAEESTGQEGPGAPPPAEQPPGAGPPPENAE